MFFLSTRIAALLVALLVSHAARGASPFAVEVKPSAPGQNAVVIQFQIPDKHHIYADSIRLTLPSPLVATADAGDKPEDFEDPLLGESMLVYHGTPTLSWTVQGWDGTVPLEATLAWSGCNDRVCFPPEKKVFTLVMQEGRVVEKTATATTTVPDPLVGDTFTLEGFTLRGATGGYLSADEFLVFLESGRSADRWAGVLEKWGIWVYLLSIVAAGVALNLTPCVLPLIPVNLAIIGAGAGGGSRRRGFALGAAYGTGIALVYGILGVVVVRYSRPFGTLNASPIFNLAIGLLFVVMALAMAGAFNIDFSRFLSRVGPQPGERSRGRLFMAVVMGGVSALLAGACVAPVIISVVALASQLYTAGNNFALFLPFAIGIGMALPWPFAGAGLSFLPKPGRWMERVKYGFAAVIALMAAYYFWLGFSLYRGGAAPAGTAHAGWHESLQPALVEARRDGKDVFVDVWATWCKNCAKMDKTTFRDERVMRALDDKVKVALQAEDITRPEIRAMLDHLGVVGLPAYALLEPVTAKEGKP